jgi:hypothetical protein
VDDEIASGETTIKVLEAEVVWLGEAESAAWIVNVYVPSAVAVPVSAPVEEFNEIPGGKLPEMIDQVIGATPPVMVKLAV